MTTKNGTPPKISTDEQGTPLAPEFVGILGSIAHETLAHWLKANGAPPEAMALLENSRWFDDYEETARHGGSADDLLRFGVEEHISEAINAIIALGGDFRDYNSISIPREPIKWKSLGVHKVKKGK